MLENGGYTPETENQRKYLFKLWDPSGGLDPFNFILSKLYKNHRGGEENEYYAAYLGLPNRVPGIKPESKTDWDDLDDGSDYYGTTERMDLAIQALADSSNLGKIYRNYDQYKDLPSKSRIERVYKLSKQIMDNPNRWQQAFGETAIDNPKGEIERNPLGMLGKFGIRWIPDEQKIQVHDTYDFNGFTRWVTGIPKRPREMKIRGKISFNPKVGAKIFRNNLEDYKLPEIDNPSK